MINVYQIQHDGITFPCCILPTDYINIIAHIDSLRSPYDHRCKSLHDPRVVTFPKLGDEASGNVVVLEHCTKAKRSGETIPDRLYHRHTNSIRQVNPLVAPYLWESCRGGGGGPSSGSDSDSLEFQDTVSCVHRVAQDDTSQVCVLC